MSENDTTRPTGALSGLLYDYSMQIQAASSHAAAEGSDVGARTVLESYDRTLHPWTHGRRPQDIADAARRWWRSVLEFVEEVADAA